MTTRYLPDSHIERQATRLLNRYERELEAVTEPPVPVEDIADGLLDLRILWDALPESAGTSTLAGLNPPERMIKFNESRQQVFQETPGLYNTVLGHEIGHWDLHVDHSLAAQQQFPELDQVYECLYQESTCNQGPRETQAHRFMEFLIMPSYLLLEAIRDFELTSWPNLYKLGGLFQVSISALTIRLERFRGPLRRHRQPALPFVAGIPRPDAAGSLGIWPFKWWSYDCPKRGESWKTRSLTGP